jgi:hypothetical protein
MIHSVLPWHRESQSQKRRNWRAAKRRRLVFEALEDRHLLSAAFISGIVYEDLNGNGALDDREHGIEGVRVDVTGVDLEGREFVLTTWTDINGVYEIVSEFASARYEVKVTAPAGWLFTTGNGIWYMDGDDPIAAEDVALYRPISIGNRVWDDLNANGLQDESEPGIGDATVTLTGTNGLGDPVSLSKTTDSSGEYWFNGLAPGTYAVSFTAPNGYVFTVQ